MVDQASPTTAATSSPSSGNDLWLYPALFAANWTDSVKVSNSFRTNISYAHDGSETRWALQTKPRRTIQCQGSAFGRDRINAVEAMFSRMGKARFLWPVFCDIGVLASQASSGGSSLTLTDASSLRLFPNGRIVIARRSDHYELFEIALVESVDTGTGVVTLVDNLASTWSEGSIVFPLIEADLIGSNSYQIHTDAHGGFALTASETAGRTALPPTLAIGDVPDAYQDHDGYPILDLHLSIEKGMAAGTLRRQQIADLGLASLTYEYGSRARKTKNIPLTFLDRDSAWDFLELWNSRAGALLPFWAIGPDSALTVTGISTSAIQVDAVWNTVDWQDRPYVYVRLRDGTIYIREIASVSRMSSTDTLTLATSLPAIDAADISHCGIACFVRFESDVLEETWVTNTVMRTQIQLTEVIGEESKTISDLEYLETDIIGTARFEVDEECGCGDLCVQPEDQLGQPGGGGSLDPVADPDPETNIPDETNEVEGQCDGIDNGSGGSDPDEDVPYVQYRKCSDDSLTPYFSTSASALPLLVDGSCIYPDDVEINFSDLPVGWQSPAGDAISGCEDNACKYYVQAFRCSDDEASGLWASESDAASYPAFKRQGACYYFDGDPVPADDVVGTILTSFLAVPSCNHQKCQFYYEVFKCFGGDTTNYAVEQSVGDAIAGNAFVYDGQCYYLDNTTFSGDQLGSKQVISNLTSVANCQADECDPLYHPLARCSNGSTADDLWLAETSFNFGQVVRRNSSDICYALGTAQSLPDGATVLSSGDVTVVASCNHSTCRFLRAYRCSDDSASDYWMDLADWSTLGGYFAFGGECYYSDGGTFHRDEFSGSVLTVGDVDSISGCADAACGASCSLASLTNTYRISGYVNGDISNTGCGCGVQGAGCGECWEGYFHASSVAGPSCPQWLPSGVGGASMTRPCIACAGGGNYGLDTGNSTISWDSGNSRWQLAIYCFATNLMWLGYKTTGSSPAGTYTRVGGCSSGPSSLSIVAA